MVAFVSTGYFVISEIFLYYAHIPYTHYKYCSKSAYFFQLWSVEYKLFFFKFIIDLCLFNFNTVNNKQSTTASRI